ncbi:MAG: pentapeptide repeat-containing protein [Cyanobacteria bacterium P01_G01_bin.54]
MCHRNSPENALIKTREFLGKINDLSKRSWQWLTESPQAQEMKIEVKAQQQKRTSKNSDSEPDHNESSLFQLLKIVEMVIDRGSQNEPVEQTSEGQGQGALVPPEHDHYHIAIPQPFKTDTTTPPRYKQLWNFIVSFGTLVAIPLVGFTFQRNLNISNREIAQDRQNTETVNAYFDFASNLLSSSDHQETRDKNSTMIEKLLASESNAAFRQLDAVRKSQVLKFMYNQNLIFSNNEIERRFKETKESNDSPICNQEQRQKKISELQCFKEKFYRFNFDKSLLLEMDLEEINLESALLPGIQLEAVNLNQSVFEDAILRRANLTNSELKGANLINIDLTNADLSGSQLSVEANLTDADLINANLTNSNLIGANLTNSDLTGANLTNSDLTGANLTNSDLTGANLTDADLIKANLTDAGLIKANLANANLTEVNLTDADLRTANLIGANLTEVDLSKTKLFGAKYANESTHPEVCEKVMNVEPKQANRRKCKTQFPKGFEPEAAGMVLVTSPEQLDD